MKYFKRFNEIDANYLYTDKHMHSTWTDGEGSVLQNVQQAKSLGLHQIAITDHIRRTSTYFPEYYDEIRRISSEEEFNVLVGFEAKVDDFQGNIDVSDENLQKADISIVSVHRFPLGRKLIAAKEFKKEVAQEIELELSIAAIQKGGFSVMGHPGGMSMAVHKEFPMVFFEEIIAACAKNDIAFDFNTSYHQPVAKELIELLKKHNPYVSLGSDAHRIHNIGKWLSFAKEINWLI